MHTVMMMMNRAVSVRSSFYGLLFLPRCLFAVWLGLGFGG